MSNLIILKEWEEDEETILKKFIQKFDLQKNQFDKTITDYVTNYKRNI